MLAHTVSRGRLVCRSIIELRVEHKEIIFEEQRSASISEYCIGLAS